MAKVTKPTDQLLPRPTIQKRRPKAAPPGSMPRRSRRVAGAGPCSPGPVVTDAQKKVIRSLGFSVEQEKFDQDTQDSYCKLFGNTLSDAHLSALAALFGWEVGEGEEVRSAASVACF
ncbi:hypothetical protein BS78_04G132800 [Paspalum vaginatum]|nr:hypothetical protein BS78_04G132800 [Paspalum vaginatum]